MPSTPRISTDPPRDAAKASREPAACWSASTFVSPAAKPVNTRVKIIVNVNITLHVPNPGAPRRT
jgi:hypothetical protein